MPKRRAKRKRTRDAHPVPVGRRQLRVRSVPRKPIDEDKLAMAFLMLAKHQAEDKQQRDKS